ncbi:MAG: ATP-dependent Zn protease [Cyanobacteria bacterium J06642_3]
MDSNKQDVGLNLLAIGIFAMTLSSLLSPILNISPFIPAGATFGILGLLTVDNLNFQSKGLTVFLDMFASKAQRQRIIHHEAGHFLTAYFLGIPIQAYTLNAWDALQAGYEGRGGVIFDSAELTEKPFKLAQTRLTLDRFCTVWMAGIAAETMIYEDAQGGAEDYFQLNLALSMSGLAPSTYAQKARWGKVQATNLLERHRDSFQALVEAMEQKKSVEECCLAIQKHCLSENDHNQQRAA